MKTKFIIASLASTLLLPSCTVEDWISLLETDSSGHGYNRSTATRSTSTRSTSSTSTASNTSKHGSVSSTGRTDTVTVTNNGNGFYVGTNTSNFTTNSSKTTFTPRPAEIVSGPREGVYTRPQGDTTCKATGKVIPNANSGGSSH